MNSDTATRYGSRVRRHGRSRAARAYQARSLRVKAWGIDLRAMATQNTGDGTRGPTAGGVISESVVLERGPVLTALILAGRIGARYAAELGTMRVTEQIDALESLGRSPMSHLILPRCLAGLITIPALVMFANLIGFLVGWFAAKQSLGISNADFEYGARYFFKSFDLWYSAIKAFAFAAAVTVIPCYIGFNTQQGAEGVGKATTQAVVASSVVVLLLDLVLAQVLLTA